MEDGDVLHPSLRSIDALTGETVAELCDPGRQLSGHAFSPIEGDTRIAITHERTGEERPATWDARTGDLVDLPTDLEGPVQPADWWPDGSALLLLQLVRRPSPAAPVRAGHRGAHDPRDRAGLDHRGRGPARRRQIWVPSHF